MKPNISQLTLNVLREQDEMLERSLCVLGELSRIIDKPGMTALCCSFQGEINGMLKRSAVIKASIVEGFKAKSEIGDDEINSAAEIYRGMKSEQAEMNGHVGAENG